MESAAVYIAAQRERPGRSVQQPLAAERLRPGSVAEDRGWRTHRARRVPLDGPVGVSET